jgi:putative addiction module component (TIGR02574 family)
MSELATQLLNQLLNLPDVEKYQIADKLWESFTLQKKEEIVSEITEDPEFQVELERRLASIEDGTAVLIDGEQVFRETRERLQKRREQ